MAVADAMTETIRVRIEPEKKATLTRLYKRRGISISQAVRQFFDSELDRFDAIMASADKKLDAYAAPEPTVDDIVNYVESIRAERAKDAVACA